MEIDSILEEVLRRIRPSREEEERVKNLSLYIVSILDEILRKSGLSSKARIEIEGSFARETWLSGDVDLDVFILFDPSLPRDLLRKYGLLLGESLAKKLGTTPLKRYASHPYIEIEYKNIKIDVVPAYKVHSAREAITPVDRTPFHTRYIRAVIEKKKRLKDEIRLLKRFTKGIGVYGAEIRTEGFSGYLLEVLTAHYGSFKDVLRAASNWKPWKTLIDPEGFYADRRKDAFLLFRSPLIVIDPVDERRNAASAVSLDKLSIFILACKELLEKPSLNFFYPSYPSVNKEKLKNLIEEQNVIGIKTLVPDMPEDTLWGQIKRSLKGIRDLLERYGFKVLDTFAWSENGVLIMLFKLTSLTRSKIEKHIGPPVYMQNSIDFLHKSEKRSDLIAGPYIDGERIAVIKRVKYCDAETLVREKVNEARLGKLIGKYLKTHMEVLVGPEVVEVFPKHEYLEELYRWLVRKLPWRYS